MRIPDGMKERHTFRGKAFDPEAVDMAHCRWAYGAYLRIDGKAYILEERGPGALMLTPIYDETLGQCLGVRDMAGNLLYEHDAVVDARRMRLSNRTYVIGRRRNPAGGVGWWLPAEPSQIKRAGNVIDDPGCADRR